MSNQISVDRDTYIYRTATDQDEFVVGFIDEIGNFHPYKVVGVAEDGRMIIKETKCPQKP